MGQGNALLPPVGMGQGLSIAKKARPEIDRA
jgi:hypothetical protein